MPALRLLFLVMLLLPAALSAQERIVNAPTLYYVAGGTERAIAANILTLDVERDRLPTQLSVRTAPVGADAARCDDGGRLVAAPVDQASVAAARALASLDPATAFLVVLDAPGSNRDPAVRETVAVDLVDGASHHIVVLTETAVASGVFAGIVPAAGSRTDLACAPVIGRRDTPTFSFAGDTGSLPTTLVAQVDPGNLVFDTTAGALIDGASVTLMTEGGAPAAVLGEDGVSAYPATVTSGAPVVDAGGHHYPAVAGRFRFPLVAAGRYRLRVDPPAGYNAPSKASAEVLAALRDAAGEPFVLTAGSSGGVVTLAAAGPIVADTPLDPTATPTLVLTRSLSEREASPGDRIEARLQLTNRGSGASGVVHLGDVLPAALRYRAGSMRGAAEPALAGNGRSLDIVLPSLAPSASADVRFILTVAPGAAAGQPTVRAQARAVLATSNVAAAAIRIRALLFTDALTLLGQVGEVDAAGGCTATPRGVAGVRLLLEDGTVVATDAAGLYHLEGVGAGRHVLALDAASLSPGLEPIDCAHDTTSAGSATTRFVEGVGGSVQRVDFRLRRIAGAAPATAAAALPVQPLDDATAAGNRDWLAGRHPGIEWLFPAAGYNPRAPVTRVAIAHAPNQRVALTINGRPVDPLSFDATDTDGRAVAVSRWVGIPLVAGENRLAARVLADDGRIVTSLERIVTVSGAPVRAVVDAGLSRLAADGVTPPLIAVRVTDAVGRAVRAGTLVPYTVEAPYAAAIDPARLGGARIGQPGSAPSATVIGDDGLAFLALRPTAQAGAVTIQIAFPVRDTTQVSRIEAWLTPAARQWTVVGFGAGSLGYDMLSRRARALPLGERDGRVVDGQLAFYAKGRIKGSWLLTMAYDSARRTDPAAIIQRGLLGQVDPNRYYTVYGDGAVQGQDAGSAARLYLRLETRQAYALFGDFETGSDEAKLTHYARTLTGLQAAYRGAHWRASGFAARVTSLAGHDEIQGNGLSGPYRLRAQNIVPNTDMLRIEVRDRYRSELVVATTPLSRHLDYEIDPQAGTVRFRAPVLSRDAALNPTFIVADYEVAGNGADRLAAGGRIEHRAGALAIGATFIHDETRTAAAGVAGVDARLQLSPGTVLRGEAASGGDRGLAGGTAFVAEVEHHHAGLDLTAYARQQALGFGLGQQSLVEAGTRKLGADGRWTLGEIAVTGTGWYQTTLGGAGERIAGQARVEWRHGTRTLFAGADIASDRGADDGDRSSRLLTMGASQVLAGGALTLTGQTQFAPDGARASVDFPVRHQVTVGWQWSQALKVIAGYEIDDGAAYRARTAQVGIEATPWRGGRLTTSLDDQGVVEGGRRFAQYSIAQSLPIGRRWSVDASLDASTTISGVIPAGAMVQAFQPIGGAAAFGATTGGQDAGDFRAVTLGTAYRFGRWSARARIEYRDGAVDKRWSLSGDVLRSLGGGRTIAASARSYRVTDLNGVAAVSIVADVALAWRPPTSHWTFLDRLTLRHDRGDPVASATGGPAFGTALGTALSLDGADQLTSRVIDNVALDYRSALDGRGRGLDIGVYYGIKYVRGRYGDESIAGLIDATGFSIRHGLGPHLDIGATASVQHAWSDHRWAWSGGPAVGVSPAGDVWMTLGYNIAGYRDRDLADDRYTRSGPYLTARLKFDAHSIGNAVRALARGGR